MKQPYRPPSRPPGGRPPGSRPPQGGRPQSGGRDSRTPQRPADDGPRVNEQIRAEKIRVVGADGEMKGVMSPREAMVLAEEAGLDLVEISPNTDPPVCKILDYGKYKYEQQKKAAEARKKQKVVDLKEIKIRPGIEQHDYDVKMRAARKFLEGGDKVKVTMRFRGREMSHIQIGRELLEKMQQELATVAKVEYAPKLEGRQMIMILVPA
ncbi:MAG: translation initiation factor IF-3 [Alphaproteobacteria bacterium PRO2]|nr:translation initiation factor IF-3 [Alphaproteobacteria bacterium PRO2]